MGHSLVEGVDFYFNELGLMVLTSAFHLKRGYCCKNGCHHCPYVSTSECEDAKVERSSEN